MKKTLFAALGMAALLSGCTAPIDPNANTSSRVLVDGLGLVSSIIQRYDFTQENPGCAVFGFCPAESFGRWSNGDEVLIDLNVAPSSEFTVKLNVNRVITPETEPFEFDVWANDSYITHISINGGGNVLFSVPKEVVGSHEFTRLRFAFKNAAQPSKYMPENLDPRKLGFAINEIIVYGYTLESAE